jgi:hypothetical protein
MGSRKHGVPGSTTTFSEPSILRQLNLQAAFYCLYVTTASHLEFRKLDVCTVPGASINYKSAINFIFAFLTFIFVCAEIEM